MGDQLFALKDRKEVAEETMAFWFDTTGTNFTFEPGQNIDLYLPDAPESGASSDQMHTFSFAQSPHHQNEFRITTRMRSDSKFKNTLKTLPLGTKLRAVGPNGNMVLHEDASRPAVFLAGGIGITPFRSMVEWATHEQASHQLYLFYSNRTVAQTTYHDDFIEWAHTNPNFHYLPTLTDEQPMGWPYEVGMIDAAMLQKHLGDLAKPVFYIAGPPGMVSAMRAVLTGAGVSRDSIKIESFTGY